MTKKIPESLLRKWIKEEMKDGRMYTHYGLPTIGNEEFAHAERHRLRIKIQKLHPELFE